MPKFLNTIQLPQRAADPGSASAGDMYLRTTDNVVRLYNGSVWVTMGPASVFIQQTNPGISGKGIWWETDASGNLVTLWVETG